MPFIQAHVLIDCENMFTLISLGLTCQFTSVLQLFVISRHNEDSLCLETCFISINCTSFDV